MRPVLAQRTTSGASALPFLLLLSCGGSDATGPNARTVAHVEVTANGASTHIFKDETLQLHAVLANAQGQPVAGPTVTWSSDNEWYGQVSASGLVTGVRQGAALITARAGQTSGKIRVDVYDPNPPREPSSPVTTVISNTQITLGWRGGYGITDSFHIERAPVLGPTLVDGTFVDVATLTGDIAEYVDTALSPTQRYRYRIRGCNKHGCSVYSSGPAVVTFPTLVIETSTMPPGNVGYAYTGSLTAVGGTGPAKWSLAAGALPPGLTLFEAGELLGAPTAAGTFNFTVRATGAGQVVERPLVIEVSDQPLSPLVTTTNLVEGIVGQPYSARLRASRGDGNYAWTITSGSLPPGLTLAADGQISGTPSAMGAFGFTAEVTSVGMTGSAELILHVIFPPIVVGTTELPSVKRGDPYSQTLQATGGDGVNYTWSIASGQLPPGLTLGASTGTISGTPTTEGLFPFTVEVVSGGRTATRPLYVNVFTLDPLIIENWYFPVAIHGTSYSHGILASGGDGSSYTYKLTAGELPPSMSLDSNTGVISGTVSGPAGTFFFSVEVQSATLTATRTFALTVSSVGAGGFNIAVAYVSEGIPSAAFRTALNQGVSKWESVITTNFPTFVMPATLPSGLCQGHGDKLRAGEMIEDFVILLDVAPIDGAGGVVARAGPCGYVLGTPSMFRAGSFLMDATDVGRLASDQLKGVTIHEIGHALGIGTMWDFDGRNLISDKGGPDPRFTGGAANAAYHALGSGIGSIPVENTGGTGTRDTHWRQTTFRNEVMTGYIEPAGVPMPLSTMTIGSMADLGWSVNPAAADPYVLPGAGLMDASEGEHERIRLPEDLAIEPYFLVLPDGGLRLIRLPGVTLP